MYYIVCIDLPNGIFSVRLWPRTMLNPVSNMMMHSIIAFVFILRVLILNRSLYYFLVFPMQLYGMFVCIYSWLLVYTNARQFTIAFIHSQLFSVVFFFLKNFFPPKYYMLYARYRRFIDTNNNKLILPGYGKACSVDGASTIVGSADAAVAIIILILCVFFSLFLLNPENS